MDLEDAAALSVCARCEEQRLERQHERIWLVASGRWCLAMRRSQQERLAASMCKEGARARAGTPSLLLTAARVSSITRHRAAVLRVMQCEARAARAGEAFCACLRCCAVCPVRVGNAGRTFYRCTARLGTSSVSRCCRFCSRTKFDLLSTSCSYKKISYASIKV